MERERAGEAAPDCARCRHFFVTWRAARPRGCRAYGFESAAWPTAVVLESSGEACKRFEVKQRTRPGSRES